LKAQNLDIFAEDDSKATLSSNPNRPLADRLRPARWEDFQGIEQLDKRLAEQLRLGKGRPPSLILWGPPGCGKTTLAKLIGQSFDCNFVEFSAVLGGVKEVRDVVELAKKTPRQTLLFVDEIHRFNKAQQDAFLPHIESGLIVLIGATTENPSFVLNNALLSRARVIPLGALKDEALQRVLERALESYGFQAEDEARTVLLQFANGDARRLLNAIEASFEAGASNLEDKVLRAAPLIEFLQNGKSFFYDRKGDEHYNLISAFIKSMRASDADAALYYAFRMIEAGEDPRFLIRRMIIFAAEDIGNADPRALMLATSTMDAFQAIGLPEGKIPISQCITYLACAPKSNRSYMAMHKAIEAVREFPRATVPFKLRNAPTGLMKDLGYGKEYIYPHDQPGAEAPDPNYLPDELEGRVFYSPSDRGYESKFRK
jgi:putative ATPase